MPDKRKIALAVLAVILFSAITLGGAAWAIAEGVRSADYVRTTATVTACNTQLIDGEEVVTEVLVTYSADGREYEGASYIGDLSRCSTGLRMNVYYLKDGDPMYVYSKSGDTGFAIIMCAGGAVWLAIAAVVIRAMSLSGRFRASSSDGRK